MSEKSDLDKALEMLKLLHPESYEQLVLVMGDLTKNNGELQHKITQLESDVASLNADVTVLKGFINAEWQHKMSSPKPTV
ncbi:hypothetical protein VPHD520_0044 [Vibrio phage D520]